MKVAKACLLAALIVLLAGCAARRVATNKGPGREVPAPSAATIKAALAPVMNDRVGALYVAFGEAVDGGYASEVVFATTAGCVYEGDVYAIQADGGWVIQDLSFGKLCQNSPVTAYEMSGRTGNGRRYRIISGVINNRKIAYVILTFADGSSTRVREEPLFHTYAFVQSVSLEKVKEVAGYSINGTLIYKCGLEDGQPSAYPV